MVSTSNPIIIQGGMGIGVSAWPLARAVARTGQLGVVSGTALDAVLSRRLQMGDPGGHVRRALAEFPLPSMVEKILDRYFIPGGKSADTPFLPAPMLTQHPTREQLVLLVVSNYVEVMLAKEGHDGLVGINYLEKVQIPTMPSLFGAMMAGVDYVLMGAGIPTTIPGVLDRLSEGEVVELPLRVTGASRDEKTLLRFDPMEFTGGYSPWLTRPRFLPIIASPTLAQMLVRKSNGRVDGFVVEGPTAGGHNAPPRGKTRLNERGEPIYGGRDVVDLAAMRALGLPFWLAGSYGSPEQVQDALAAGAAGVQVGTAFAFCAESGILAEIKEQVVRNSRVGKLTVFTDPRASPAGFPFKVLGLEETLSEESEYDGRQRTCDLGFLREGYHKADGTLGWRCPAESVASYVHKGGLKEETIGRKCICNGLLATIGLGQVRSDGRHERPLVTSGNDVNNIRHYLKQRDVTSYSASDVVACLLERVQSPEVKVER
jgi:nitronate monooxygenase